MAFLAIAIGTSLAIIVMALTASKPTYHFAPVLLLPVVWAIYLLRSRLNLAPVHYALVVSAILLHMSGAYGFYQQSPLPFSFDILVHYYFALVLTLGFFRLIEGNFPALKPWHVFVITFFVMMGVAALHEVMEFMSYLALGEKNGMLKPATSYFFDTQRDLTNNLLGTLTSLAGLFLIRRARKAP